MNSTGSVEVEAPCSTANLGAGFDVFGLALGRYADRVRARLTETGTIRIRIVGPYAGKLPRSPEKNSAGPPVQAMIDGAGRGQGVEITIEKNIPPGLGLGSSGATAAASAKALNHLLRLNLPGNELVRFASLGEAAVSGFAHMDNVGASLLGGFVIAYGTPKRVLSVRPPTELAVVVASPKVRSPRDKTGAARRLVPRKIETQNAVLNVGRASAIVLGFAKGDISLIGTGMEDAIAEPYREDLIPGYRAVKRAALVAKASGVAISGAGPSVVAFVDRKEHSPTRVGKSMVKEFSRNNVQSTFLVTRPSTGARVIRSD